MSIRLLIVDDHLLFRTGLRHLCELKGGFTVLAEAEDGLQAAALARLHRPDVILMDLRMPGLTGVEASRLILEENGAARILILTVYHRAHDVLAALRAGARGYLLKSAGPETLFDAVRAVHAGAGWLDPDIIPAVLAHLPGPEDRADVSEKEIELLRLVARGEGNRAIADRLDVSGGTVARRLRVVFEKIGVSSRTEAALYALRQGWASLDPEE